MLSPKLNSNITPGGPQFSPEIQKLLDNKLPDNNDNDSNTQKNKKRVKGRSRTQAFLGSSTLSKLRSITEENTQKSSSVSPPPKIITDFSNNIYNKAVELYDNKKYDAAEEILKTIIMLNADDQNALELYEKIKDTKDYNKLNKTSPWTVDNKANIPPPPPTKKNTHFYVHRQTLGSKLKAQEKEKEEKTETATDTVTVKTEEKEKEIEETHEIDPCQLEFQRFLDDRVKIKKVYPDLHDRFEKEGYNDIRYVLDLDKEILEKEIKLKKLHIKNFMRKIDVFKTEINAFQKWVKNIVSNHQQYSSLDGLIDKFENKGILTFESLFRYVLCKQDLINVIGKEFHNVHRILWMEIGNQQSELIQSVTTDVNDTYSTALPGANQSDDEEIEENNEGDTTKPPEVVYIG